MQAAGHCQGEGGDVGFELAAIIAAHVVITLHGANRRFEYGAATVFKRFAGLEVGLFADDAFTFYFFLFAVGIGDVPVPMGQLGRFGTVVLNRDFVSEDKSVGFGGALGIDVTDLGGDVDLILSFVFHGPYFTLFK